MTIMTTEGGEASDIPHGNEAIVDKNTTHVIAAGIKKRLLDAHTLTFHNEDSDENLRRDSYLRSPDGKKLLHLYFRPSDTSFVDGERGNMVEIKLADLTDVTNPSLYWLRLDPHEVEHSFFEFSPVTHKLTDTENKYPAIESLVFVSPPVEVASDEYLGMIANGIDPDEYYKKSIDPKNISKGISLLKELITDGMPDEEAIDKSRKNFEGRITHDLEIRDNTSSQLIADQIDGATRQLPEVLNYALTRGDE